MVSLARNLFTLLPKPVDSRNQFTSKEDDCEFALLSGGREAFREMRRAGDGVICEPTMEPASENCLKKNTSGKRPRGRPGAPGEPFAATGALPAPHRNL